MEIINLKKSREIILLNPEDFIGTDEDKLEMVRKLRDKINIRFSSSYMSLRRSLIVAQPNLGVANSTNEEVYKGKTPKYVLCLSEMA